jgi:hypothetical protein
VGSSHRPNRILSLWSRCFVLWCCPGTRSSRWVGGGWLRAVAWVEGKPCGERLMEGEHNNTWYKHLVSVGWACCGAVVLVTVHPSSVGFQRRCAFGNPVGCMMPVLGTRMLTTTDAVHSLAKDDGLAPTEAARRQRQQHRLLGIA